MNFSILLVGYFIQNPDYSIITSTLSDLSPYQAWLIDPENFKIDWIRLSDVDIILEYLGNSKRTVDLSGSNSSADHLAIASGFILRIHSV